MDMQSLRPWELTLPSIEAIRTNWVAIGSIDARAGQDQALFFAPHFCFAHLRFCAAAIRARASGLRVRFFLTSFG
jgi:hypothetical protein